MTSRILRPSRPGLWIVTPCLAALAAVLVSITLLRHQIVTAVAHNDMKNRGLLCEGITADVPLAIPPDGADWTIIESPMRDFTSRCSAELDPAKTRHNVNALVRHIGLYIAHWNALEREP